MKRLAFTSTVHCLHFYFQCLIQFFDSLLSPHNKAVFFIIDLGYYYIETSRRFSLVVYDSHATITQTTHSLSLSPFKWGSDDFDLFNNIVLYGSCSFHVYFDNVSISKTNSYDDVSLDSIDCAQHKDFFFLNCTTLIQAVRTQIFAPEQNTICTKRSGGPYTPNSNLQLNVMATTRAVYTKHIQLNLSLLYIRFSNSSLSDNSAYTQFFR